MEVIVKILLVHPNLEDTKTDCEYDSEYEYYSDYDDSESESDVDETDDETKVGSKPINRKPFGSIDVGNKLNDDLKQILLSVDIVPRFNLNVEEIKIVKFSSQLLENLNLILNYKRMLSMSRTTKEFDETLSYKRDMKQVFKKLVTKQDGYLDNESNYFYVDKQFLTKGTKTVSLRNTRVILFWRKIDIEDKVVKRILTLGLLFLIGEISIAELTFMIKKLIPNNTFEVSIKYKKNTYLLIGIEKPIFSS